MFIYAFRQSDMCYSGPVEVPDGTVAIPPYHTFQAPPEQEGFHAVMGNAGWYLVDGLTPPAPAPWVPSPEQILEEKRSKMIVSPFQGRMALIGANLMDQVEAIIANPDTPKETKVAWEYATEWKRLSPMIEGLGGVLGLDGEQIDNLFEEAAQITA